MQLCAGNLLMQYEDGFLRWITAGEDEVLRMLYFAIRDKDWNTVPGHIVNEKIEGGKNCFTISYEMLFDQNEIKMHWHIIIEGKANNRVLFDIKGKALAPFKKNRIGFCVLHPYENILQKRLPALHL